MTAELSATLAVWHVQVLGDLQVRAHPGAAPQRPASRAAGLLLAQLALAPERAHPRETLVELLWPGVALDVGRNRLREALCTLNRFLQASSSAPVLQADRSCIRVLPGRLRCDAPLFEQAARRGDAMAARALYGGELLPGHYDEWVLRERQRLEHLHEELVVAPLRSPLSALLTLPQLLLRAGHVEAAAMAEAVAQGVAPERAPLAGPLAAQMAAQMAAR
jgi:DNA-binding SARP family transcriptional activator